MTLLILGASGFIGNACYEQFSATDQVIGVDLLDRHSKGLLLDPDLNKVKELIAGGEIDVVLNCAGSANIRASFSSPETDLLSNTTYVKQVLSLLKNFSPKTKFINISSAAVYGNPESLPVPETAKTNPLSPYGKHKLLSEKILRDYSSLDTIPTLSVRIFSAYGPGLRQQLFYDLHTKFKSHEKEITLFGTGNESRDFIYITDIVDAFEVLIKSAPFNGEVYNLGSGIQSFIGEAAATFANIVGYPGRINFSNEHIEGYPLNWHADISKLKSLGFVPRVTIEQGLAHYATWLKNNPA